MRDRSFEVFVSELLQPIAGVVFRRMFGGAGLFRDGLMFGLITGGVLHFKADASTIPAYQEAGAEPFAYDTKGGTRILTSYWRVPEALFDDPDLLVEWAREADAVARQAAAAKGGKTRRAAKSVGTGDAAGTASRRRKGGAAAP